MDIRNIKHVAADGDITTVDSYLNTVVLTAGSDAATVVVKAGGTSGTTILTLKAAANTTVSTGELGDVYCDGGIYADVTGTAMAAMFVYS